MKQMRRQMQEGQIFYIIATIALVIGIVTAIVCDIGNLAFAVSAPCYLNTYVHLYCPGCGGTRAAFALMHLHLVESVCCNPIPLYLLGLFLYYYIGTTLAVRSRGRKIYFKPGWWMLVVFVALLVWTFGVRNVLAVRYGLDYLGDVAAWW